MEIFPPQFKGRTMKEWLEDQKLKIDKVLWKEQEFVIFRATDGTVWRYMPSFNNGWPFEIKE